MGTTCFSITTPRAATCRWTWTSALRSRARLNPTGEVYATETPAGMVAVAVHVGAYERIKETHDAIHAWREACNRTFAGKSWEIYGDWSDDPAKRETTIMYLLR